MGLRITHTRRPGSAFTLVEAMMALGVACLVLGGLLALYLYSNRSFAALTNHVFMEQQNQVVMDTLSREIRGAKQITAYSQRSLSFTDDSSSSVSLVYDPARKVFFRVRGGLTNVLLTSCSSLRFQIYPDTVQSNAFDVLATATNLAKCRLVGVSWTCSREVAGVINSEPLQCAKILVRNANGGG